ncbi:hypothetical protein DFH09DRAFT_1331471 [Mycena vulgaris]|nr:hypothetical protein DFH09DRAFT_1331471 [Mycena vulgaris]
MSPSTLTPTTTPETYLALTPSEATALLRFHNRLVPDRRQSTPIFTDSSEDCCPPRGVRVRRPADYYERLSGIILRENTLQRTLHPIPPSLPDTPDERIRHTFRRKSYPTQPGQFDEQASAGPLW